MPRSLIGDFESPISVVLAPYLLYSRISNDEDLVYVMIDERYVEELTTATHA